MKVSRVCKLPHSHSQINVTLEYYKKVTNGDVMRAMFPNLRVHETKGSVVVFGEEYEFQHHYPTSWWNALYMGVFVNETKDL